MDLNSLIPSTGSSGEFTIWFLDRFFELFRIYYADLFVFYNRIIWKGLVAVIFISIQLAAAKKSLDELNKKIPGEQI